MTVTYTSEVATTRFGSFLKLLFRWRGSVFKLLWVDFIIYSLLYFTLSIIYRFALTEPQRRTFEKISLYTDSFSNSIPLSFVLGFYITLVVKRWWDQYLSLPGADSLSLFISTSIVGSDTRARMMRRTIVRYANLSLVLTLRTISPPVKKRFPTLDHIVEAGILTTSEQKILTGMEKKTKYSLYWMPLVWAGAIVARARKEARIRDDFAVQTILVEINRLRGLCETLLSYDWISIPLVYTQVVTLAVYTFFLATLMGRQFLDPAMKYDTKQIDIVVPIFTYLQLLFYMGWLKVAESLVNPFGEDDDDFETNYYIDKRVAVAYLIVDGIYNEHPEIVQDSYWEQVFPKELPYTKASVDFKIEAPQGSTANIEISKMKQEILPVAHVELEDMGRDRPARLAKTAHRAVLPLREARSISSDMLTGISMHNVIVVNIGQSIKQLFTAPLRMAATLSKREDGSTKVANNSIIVSLSKFSPFRLFKKRPHLFPRKAW